jgi:hypothetical protein
MISYEIWLSTSTGTRFKLLEDFISLKFVRVANGVGAFSLVLPNTINLRHIERDQMVEIWRSVDSGIAQFEMLGLVRRYQVQEAANGVRTITLSGLDGNSLLDSRIVAYAAGTAQTRATSYADDEMKAVVRENLGASATDTERDLSTYGFQVEPNLSLGPAIEKRFSWKNVLATLQEFSKIAYEEGTPVYFDMVPRIVSNTRLAWRFETYINQPGADRTYASGNPTVFSSEWGNLIEPVLTLDYSDERTVVYSGGQGEGSNRLVQEVKANTLIDYSPWSRRETFYNASNQANTAAALIKLGKKQLREYRVRPAFQGKLLSTTHTRYGVEWKFGDRVVASFNGRQFEGLISGVAITVNRNGEQIDAKLEVDS